MYETVSELQDLANKFSYDKLDKLVKSATTFRKIMPNFDNIIGLRIHLTNNEIKDNITVIGSLENRGFFLKRATNKK